MPIRVEIMPDEPIVMYIYEGQITSDDVLNARRQVMDAINAASGLVVRINDTRRAALSFSDGLNVLATMTRDVPGSARDGRVVDVAVAGDQLVNFLTESLSQEQYGAINVPIFGTLDEALTFARERINA